MNFKEHIDKLTWFEKLEVLRIKKGWSQYKAAEMCNTSQKGYWLWENGKVYPTKNSQIAITTAFDVNIDDIFVPS